MAEIKPQGTKGVLLDSTVFFDASRNGCFGKNIMYAAEKNKRLEKHNLTFYTTNYVVYETKHLPQHVRKIIADRVNYLDITHIDDVINNLTNGASKTDKSLIHTLATNPQIDILVSNDNHIFNEDVVKLIAKNYNKPVQICDHITFVRNFLKPNPKYLGLGEAEDYVWTDCKFGGSRNG